MKKIIKISAFAVAIVMASCTDFVDYNTVNTQAGGTGNLTLWESISQNEQLTQFTTLIKKAGFDDELQASQFYTLWAPLNNTFKYDSICALDSALIRDRFIENHVTRYNFGVSGSLQAKRIHTLNDKMFVFDGTGKFTYDGKEVSKLNQPCLNGVIHLMNGAAEYHPNIYEYLFDAEGVTSLQNYFKHYETSYLDERASVEGPLVNGHQSYIDSVMITTNSLFRRFNADIQTEDSSYTMLMPTDAAWEAAYNRIKPYFNYIAKTAAENLAGITTTTMYKTVDAAYFTDSLTKMVIASKLIFDNRLERNLWAYNTAAENTDTLRFTTGNLSNCNELLSYASEPVLMSNGYARLLDTLAIRPWDSWCSSIHIGATLNTYRPSVKSATVNAVRLNQNEVDTSKCSYIGSYANIIPASSSANPVVSFYLPNVLSTTYNIYCVFVPANIRKADSLVVNKPCKVNFKLVYCTEKGALKSVVTANAITDETKVDTVLVGQYTFPVAYLGLGSYYPSLTVTSKRSVLGKVDREKYDNQLRIASVILRPVEQEEFEKQQ